MPRHQLDTIDNANNFDTSSLHFKNEPSIFLTEEIPSDISQVVILPNSLRWLLPSTVITLTLVSKLIGTLLVETGKNSTIDGDFNFLEYIESRDISSQEIQLVYPIYRTNKDLIIIFIPENDLKYPTILQNYLIKSLSDIIKNFQSTILINCDKILELKTLSQLKPPEFISGSVSRLVMELLPFDKLETIIIPSEGMNGFEKINADIVDSLVELMKQKFNFPINYSAECYRYWKLENGTQGQCGLYI